MELIFNGLETREDGNKVQREKMGPMRHIPRSQVLANEDQVEANAFPKIGKV